MDRYTRSDVTTAANWLMIAAREHGVSVEGWAVRAGSPTYGRGWLLIDIDPRNGGQHTVAYLGDSAREAYNTLRGMREAYALLPRAVQS